MRRFLIIVFVLLLHFPQPPKALADGPDTGQRDFPETRVSEKSERFSENEDEIFSTTYERELLSRKIFKKSLPPLSRKEKIRWSFKTSRADTFL
jgi:hypothetical protein